MKKNHYFTLLLNALFMALPLLAMQPQEKNLQARWEEEIKSPKKLSDRNLLKSKHVIFIGGIMNELASALNFYFTDNIATVREELGGTASYFGPDSEISIPENVENLYDFIKETYEEEKKPLILVGHSKGGAEILALLLKHYELIFDKITWQACLIQPAIWGSPLADESSGLLLDIMTTIFSPNLSTLTTIQSQHNFDNAFIEYEQTLVKKSSLLNSKKEILHDKISSRIFYILSETTESEISFGTSLMLTVLQSNLSKYPGKHDGLLPITSQFHPRIGKVLGIVKSDHLGLTVRKVSKVSKHDRKAFTRLMFRILAEEELHYGILATRQ